MSRKTNRVIIQLNVGDQFKKDIRRTMEDELQIASKKWNVELNTAKQEHVIDVSYRQLMQKIFEVAKISWDGESILEVRASSAGPLHKDFTLPTDAKKFHYLRVVRMRDGWTFTTDDTEDTVAIPDFLETFQNMILQWARTATFYGVGSYK